jgi:hypothetical protein
MPRTAKNKANTTTSPSPTKKWKWTPGLGSVVTSSTSGTRTRNMILDLVETRVDGVFIGICTKAWAPDETAYLFPMEKGLNDTKNGGDLAKDWKYVYSFFPRRDTDIDDGITPMKTKKGSKWDWKVVLLLIDEEDDTSIKKAGHHIAHCFSKFTRNKNVMEKTESYTYNKCIRNNPQALNHYLLDMDVAKVLKSLVCHEGSEYASKEDVLRDNEVMEAFFGTSDVGRAYLEDMKEEDWDYLLDGTDN